jgi:hypothetical protein
LPSAISRWIFSWSIPEMMGSITTHKPQLLGPLQNLCREIAELNSMKLSSKLCPPRIKNFGLAL